MTCCRAPPRQPGRGGARLWANALMAPLSERHPLMTSTPTPVGYRPGRTLTPLPPLPPTVEGLRAEAEVYLMDYCGLPEHLMPSALSGPLQHVALELRSMVQRQRRLLLRLNTAALSIAGQAVELVESSARGAVAPADAGPVLNVHELAEAGELRRAVLELDDQIRRWVQVLLRMAAELEAAHPSATPWNPWK